MAASSTPSALTSRRRTLKRLTAVALLGGVVLGCAVGARRFAVSTLVGEALKQGVQLSECGLDVGLAAISLEACRFALVTPARGPGLLPAELQSTGTIAQIKIELDGLSARRVVVSGAAAELRGEVGLTRLRQLVATLPAPDASPAPKALPVDFTSGQLRWGSSDAASSALEVRDLSYSTGSQVLSAAVHLGGLEGRLSGTGRSLELVLGGDVPTVRVGLLVSAQPPAARLRLDLRGLEADQLTRWGLALPSAMAAVQLNGRVSLRLPLGLSAAAPDGDLDMTLRGLAIPAPRELAGLVHTEAPRVTARIAATRSFDRVRLDRLTVLVGALELKGGGEATLGATGTAFAATVRGPLSCRAIIDASVNARPQSVLSAVARRLNQRLVRGSVDVVLAVTGTLEQLERATVVPSVGIGCGLKPLPLEGLGLPADYLRRLPSDLLDALPSLEQLPRLDQLQLPDLPRLPTLGVTPVEPPSNPAE